MSLDPRNDETARCAEKLVKCILGDKVNASERRIHEHQALQKLRHHRYMSTNGHGVRRDVINMLERFYIESMDEIADAVCTLSNRIIEHVGWNGHYELDIQYSMLDFLLSVTYEPVQNVRRDLQGMEQHIQEVSEAIADIVNVPIEPEVVVAPTPLSWLAILSDNDASSHSESLELDATLSDWSDTFFNAEDGIASSLELSSRSSCQSMALVRQQNLERYQGIHDSSSSDRITIRYQRYKDFSDSESSSCSSICSRPSLEPPERQTQYTQSIFNPCYVYTMLHSKWWRQDIVIYTKIINNDPPENFAIAHIQHLNRETRSMTKHKLPKTTCESNLLRETLFMFFAPTSCGFYEVHPESFKISVRTNITVSSVSIATLHFVLEDEVLPAMQAMSDLCRIIKQLMLNICDVPNTGTLACFAYGLNDLIQPIKERLMAFERRLIEDDEDEEENDDDDEEQNDDDDVESSTSLIAFLRYMKEEFKLLLYLQSLINCALIKGPPYLRSAHLLSQLFKHTTLNHCYQKIVTGLLLVSLRRYCCIMDNWWKFAELDDCNNEFIVECLPQTLIQIGNRMTERLMSIKDNAMVNQSQLDIVMALCNCPFYQLLLRHALEVGETQDLLDSVQLLGDLVLRNRDSNSLYTQLIQQMCKETDSKAKSQTSIEPPMKSYNQAVLATAKSLGNQELMDMFTYHIREAQRVEESSVKQKLTRPSVQLLDILDNFKHCGELQQPHFLASTLNRLLQQRYEVANVYVMRWYFEELQLADHVRFLRHIMLLESDYLLFPYYTKMFEQIESFEDWASGSLLTMELYDRLEPHYGALANDLEVHLISRKRCKTNKIYEALDAIKLTYDMPPPLQSIITDNQMSQYNGIWRTVLKIKWAAWKLENMRIVRRYARDIYAPLDLFTLTLRRLEILRFWLISLIYSFHSHLCTQVMSMGGQFEQQLTKTSNIRELRNMHADYMELLCKHCFVTTDFEGLQSALEQIFNLIFVLDMEWNSLPSFLHDSNALSVDLSGTDGSESDKSDEDKGLEYLAFTQIDTIEHTYIRCHRMLANTLSNLVYKKDHKFLNSLEVAVNASMPH